MVDRIPYVHTYTLTLERMPLLANGSNAAVFLSVALLEPTHPHGVSEQVIANYTGKGIATVRTALANLQSSAMVKPVSEGLYLTSEEYARWGRRACTDAAGADGDLYTKKGFCTMNDDVPKDILLETSVINHSFMKETAKILSAAGIEGANVDRLASKVSPANARLWADWLEHVDRKRWTRPEGYCYNRLREDPLNKPPYVKKPRAEAVRDYKKNPVVTGALAQKWLKKSASDG